MPEPALSITDFLTNAELAALAGALSGLSGRTVTLHNPHGHRVERAPNNNPPWEIITEPCPPGESFPIVLDDGKVIGSLCIAGETAGEDLRDAVRLLARTVAELCDQHRRASGRLHHLNTLFTLSSALVSATTVDEVLAAALSATEELRGFDAVTIHLLDEEAGLLRLASSRGLAVAPERAIASLPAAKTIDTRALSGEIVEIPDLAAAKTVIGLDQLSGAGLSAMASLGLVFKGECHGIMRLYTRGSLRLTGSRRNTLRSVAEQVAGAVASIRLIEQRRVARQTARQLALARAVQSRMLPARPPEVPGLEIGARIEFSLELGGDFYDLRPVGDALFFLVGDVVGKGVPAALMMASIRATIRTLAEQGAPPARILDAANRALCAESLPNEFASILVGLAHPQTGAVHYANAGHELPVLIPADPALPPAVLDHSDLLAGVVPDSRYHERTLELAPGDTFLLYTDGLTDSMDFDARRWGREGLLVALAELRANHHVEKVQTFVDQLAWHARRRSGVLPLADDTTLLAVRRAGGPRLR